MTGLLYCHRCGFEGVPDTFVSHSCAMQLDKPAWRKARAEAFKAGAYTMRVPDVTTGGWGTVSWCNWVRFNDPELSGFDDGKPEVQS